MTTSPALKVDPHSTLWVTDAELIRRSGVPERVMRENIRMWDADPRFHFPSKIERYGDRRYWPAVEGWLLGMTPEERAAPAVPLDEPPKPTLPERPFVELPTPKNIVYFIQAGHHIKIGVTSGNVDRRLKELSTGHYDELVVLATVEDAPAPLEFELHQRFAAHRVRGEWFKAAPELLAYIEEIKARPK